MGKIVGKFNEKKLKKSPKPLDLEPAPSIRLKISFNMERFFNG